MEAGTVTALTEENQQDGGQAAAKEAAQLAAAEAAAKAKERKPARRAQAEPQPERGQALQALQRHGQPAAGRRDWPAIIGVKVGEAKMQRFADGEVYFQLLENVRGVDVFVVQPTCYPVDQHLVELLVMIDALKRASAARITVVVPYYGYARQDRKDRSARGHQRQAGRRPADHRRSQPRLCSLTCTRRRFRASSTFPSIISTPARCW